MLTFYSHGKLLITGEYVVLDGAKALAVPTRFGQYMTVETIEQPKIIWSSIDNEGNIWFEDSFLKEDISLSYTPRNEISDRLIEILNAVKKLNPDFINQNIGYKITTTFEFPKNWGLGTSSTLINNIAKWAKVDPFKLLDLTFGGSGYDIACAQHNSALIYQLENNQPQITVFDFKLSFSDQLYFVHLNKKQNSRDGIAHYKTNKDNLANTITKINTLTDAYTSCTSIDDFKLLMEQHELLIAKITNQKTVKDILFSDFKGSIKSLGAWGGDFILVASKTNPTDYFKSKGFNTILKYDDMVLSQPK